MTITFHYMNSVPLTKVIPVSLPNNTPTEASNSEHYTSHIHHRIPHYEVR
jgi:hypothetical protein